MGLLLGVPEREEVVRAALQPGLEIRAEPLIGGDHLQHLTERHLLQRLGGFSHRHRAEEPVAIEHTMSDYIFHTV